MIEALDSRSLRRTDCYGQRFMKAGTYRYNVLPAHGHCMSDARPFTLTVREGEARAETTQHDVVVRARDGGFDVDQPELAIATGDLVLWNCPNAQSVAYTVIGDKEFFASHRLVNESGYSHAFGLAGEYHWADAHGSGASGVVRVKDPGCKSDADIERWRRVLAKGILVRIADKDVEPREVEIVTGQTVFFVVIKGPGISITDRRLLGEHPDEREPATASAASRKKK